MFNFVKGTLFYDYETTTNFYNDMLLLCHSVCAE